MTLSVRISPVVSGRLVGRVTILTHDRTSEPFKHGKRRPSSGYRGQGPPIDPKIDTQSFGWSSWERNDDQEQKDKKKGNVGYFGQEE